MLFNFNKNFELFSFSFFLEKLNRFYLIEIIKNIIISLNKQNLKATIKMSVILNAFLWHSINNFQ